VRISISAYEPFQVFACTRQVCVPIVPIMSPLP
jgi:hypothetical protein